jgi:hypothetical protein
VESLNIDENVAKNPPEVEFLNIDENVAEKPHHSEKSRQLFTNVLEQCLKRSLSPMVAQLSFQSTSFQGLTKWQL